MEEPKIIKITPYRGLNEEVEGRKTKISLYPDRMEYSIKLNQKATITKGDDLEVNKEVISYSEEDGFLMKSSIVSIVKYIETTYDENLEPVIVNYVDVCGNGSSLTFSVENEEAKFNLYKDLREWMINQ